MEQQPSDGGMSVLVRECLTTDVLEGEETGQWLRDLTELML